MKYLFESLKEMIWYGTCIGLINLTLENCFHINFVMCVKFLINLGPVFVEFPIDILYPYALVKKEVLGSRRSSGLRARLVSW